jgi:single-strand DNA-binding protein
LREVIPGEQSNFGAFNMFGDGVDPAGEFADYYLRFGVGFADGRRTTNLHRRHDFDGGPAPDPPTLRLVRWESYDLLAGEVDVWVWGLPRRGRWSSRASGRPAGSPRPGSRSTPAWSWRPPIEPCLSGRAAEEDQADSLSRGDRVMVTGRLRQRSWETPEGDKRSVTVIEADEVGASLKWATAKVERASQRGNGERSSGRSGKPSAAGTSTTPRRSNKQPHQRPQLRWGRCTLVVAPVRSKATSSLPFVLPRTCGGERRGQTVGSVGA